MYTVKKYKLLETVRNNVLGRNIAHSYHEYKLFGIVAPIDSNYWIFPDNIVVSCLQQRGTKHNFCRVDNTDE